MLSTGRRNDRCAFRRGLEFGNAVAVFLMKKAT
jgi:hypothetical protein